MPSNTTSRVFFYVYVLESLKDDKRYIGFTHDLRKRVKEHEQGKSFATKFRLPFELVYYEACLNKEDAKRRENYLKTTQGPVRQLRLFLLQMVLILMSKLVKFNSISSNVELSKNTFIEVALLGKVEGF